MLTFPFLVSVRDVPHVDVRVPHDCGTELLIGEQELLERERRDGHGVVEASTETESTRIDVWTRSLAGKLPAGELDAESVCKRAESMGVEDVVHHEIADLRTRLHNELCVADLDVRQDRHFEELHNVFKDEPP